MSYQVIARKWRPQTFDEVTGQSHVTTPLRNAIRADRIPHALLLTGPRGVGKTTLARILARCLNCEKGPTDEPCGTCDACEEIISGRATDVQEIDAASRTGVDDMREVIESIRYAPSPGKYRIFVVDEVHMLSTAAFNALLKTLEEPPPRSLFVFATTNPEKIPFTVLSRCQRYDLRRIPATEVAHRLGEIAKAEGVEITSQSLLALAREGDGSMRDSQTLMDQVISFGGSQIDDATVGQVLDLIDRRVLISILRACVESNPAEVLSTCATAADKGSDPRRLGSALIQLLRDLVVISIAPDNADELVEGSSEDVAELLELAKVSDVSRLRRMFRILVKEQEDLAWAPHPFAVLEMALVRLATMPEGGDVSQLIGRLDSLERRMSSGKGSDSNGGGGGGSSPSPGAEVGRASAAQRATRTESNRTAPSVSGSVASPAISASSPVASPPRASSGSTPRVAKVRRESDLGDASSQGDPETDSPSAEDMASPEIVIDRLRSLAKERSQALYHSLQAVSLVDRTATTLRFAADGAFYVKRLEDRRSELDELCQQFFGRPMKIEVSQANGSRPTPEQSRENPTSRPTQSGGGAKATEAAPKLAGGAANREQDRLRRQAALNHPAINLVLREMRAEIVEIRALEGASGKPQ